MSDVCKACGEPLRVVCSACLRRVRVQDGKIVAHDSATCQGSHMSYGSCSGSGKKLPEAPK